MGLFGKNKRNKDESGDFPWIEFNSFDQLERLLEAGKNVVIFKHSTRCGISTMVKSSFERKWNISSADTELLLLDLLQYRALSNHIADFTKVTHQSPQAIVFVEGKYVYNASHSGIDATYIQNELIQHG